MKRYLSTLIFAGAAAMAQAQTEGLVTVASRYPVAETAQRIADLAEARHMLVFARIDFAADARRAGMALNDSQLVLFGNPKGGTPVMQVNPSAAVDLPLKALAWRDAAGAVWVSYNAPSVLYRGATLHGTRVRQAAGRHRGAGARCRTRGMSKNWRLMWR